MSLKKDRERNLKIDYFSVVKISAIRVRLAVAELVNSIFINVQANMAAWAHRINIDILFSSYQSQTTLASF